MFHRSRITTVAQYVARAGGLGLGVEEVVSRARALAGWQTCLIVPELLLMRVFICKWITEVGKGCGPTVTDRDLLKMKK